MTIQIADGRKQSLSQVATMMTFADPAAGASPVLTVPAGKAWRLWGGSCHVAGSAFATPRTPTLTLSLGTTTIYVASNGLGYDQNANQTVVYYEQRLFQDGPPWMTGPGDTWDNAVNPAALVYNPIGIRAIWLPAGAQITYLMWNMQPGDQATQVGALIEEITV